MPTDDFKLITEAIGPVAAVALLIGTAVGMSIFMVPTPVLKVVAVGNVVVSLAFTVLVAASAPTALAFMLGCVVVASLAYRYRLRVYERQGVDLRERMSLLHNHEVIGGAESEGDD